MRESERESDYLRVSKSIKEKAINIEAGGKSVFLEAKILKRRKTDTVKVCIAMIATRI